MGVDVNKIPVARIARMMIDVDPRFRAPHERGRRSKAALRCGIEGDGNVEILWLAQGRLQKFAAGQKTVLLEKAILVPHHDRLSELRERKAKTELTAERVAVRADMTEYSESLLRTQDRADFVETRLLHSFSGVSISWRISKTRAPRSIESSR